MHVFYSIVREKMMLAFLIHFSMLMGVAASDIYDDSWALIIGIMVLIISLVMAGMIKR